jgi:hypothetical protein
MRAARALAMPDPGFDVWPWDMEGWDAEPPPSSSALLVSRNAERPLDLTG